MKYALWMAVILTWWTILFLLGILISFLSTQSLTNTSISVSALVALVIPISIYYIQWMTHTNIYREHYIGFTLGAFGIIALSMIIFVTFVFGIDLHIDGPAKYLILYTISLAIAVLFGLFIGSMWDPSELIYN